MYSKQPLLGLPAFGDFMLPPFLSFKNVMRGKDLIRLLIFIYK